MSHRALGSEFDLRLNMKAKPNSQGTLFQVATTARTPESRQPRGYSPERQAEVLDALGQRKDNTAASTPSSRHTGILAETRMAMDTISRSTVPAQHLKGLTVSAGQTMEAKGMYNAPGQGGMTSPAVAFIAKGQARTATPIHEIGHHVSHEVELTGHSLYSTPHDRGLEEGFAENYADQHFRDRRGGRQRSNNPAVNWSIRENDSDSKWSFSDGFEQQRKMSSLKAPTLDSLAAQGLPANHVEGQIPLLNKVTEYPPWEGSAPRPPEPVQTWQYANPERDWR